MARLFGLSHLTSRGPGRFQPVDGLRAFSVLWMVVFHSIYHLGAATPQADFLRILQWPALRLLEQGHLGVDVFFVISGFLISSLLLREVERADHIDFRGFYLRRAFRILPAYAIALLLGALVLGPEAHLSSAWANLLFINNFLPIARQALPWTWSLAIEEQFYLVFPVGLLLLHRLAGPGRRALPWLASALGAGFVLNYALVRHHGIYVPPPLHESLGAREFARYFDGVYDKTYARYGGILCGVIVAYLARIPAFMAWARRHAGAILIGGLSVLATIALQPMVLAPGRVIPRELLVIYLAAYRYVFAMGVAATLLHALVRPEGRLSRALSRPFWGPISELSYGAYLLHPLAIIVVYRAWPFPAAPGPLDLLPRFALIYAATFGAAYLLYSLVERPLRDEGRSLAARPSHAGHPDRLNTLSLDSVRK